mmetsp:Transcript_150989/g.485228  ORF Transcript_150989/g.485228 Transcript_150989/m.485228 type:complete len:242 (+) Transcript_150989:283-1008(+)
MSRWPLPRRGARGAGGPGRPLCRAAAAGLLRRRRPPATGGRGGRWRRPDCRRVVCGFGGGAGRQPDKERAEGGRQEAHHDRRGHHQGSRVGGPVDGHDHGRASGRPAHGARPHLRRALRWRRREDDFDLVAEPRALGLLAPAGARRGALQRRRRDLGDVRRPGPYIGCPAGVSSIVGAGAWCRHGLGLPRRCRPRPQRHGHGPGRLCARELAAQRPGGLGRGPRRRPAGAAQDRPPALGRG